MAKWADYLISAVRYNDEETHIDKVMVHEDKSDTVGGGIDMARARVVTLLEAGNEFATIYKSSDDKWRLGAQVGIVVIGGEKFIRTHSDNTKADNLGDLPRY